MKGDVKRETCPPTARPGERYLLMAASPISVETKSLTGEVDS
jgi:hypothetical protein